MLTTSQYKTHCNTSKLCGVVIVSAQNGEIILVSNFNKNGPESVKMRDHLQSLKQLALTEFLFISINRSTWYYVNAQIKNIHGFKAVVLNLKLT